jgi:uncharacterized membrane protein YfhO
MKPMNMSKKKIQSMIISRIVVKDVLEGISYKSNATEYGVNINEYIENIYVSDLKLQHLVFLNNLKNILSGDASVFYSFSAGMGSPMISTLIFYCISPVRSG